MKNRTHRVLHGLFLFTAKLAGIVAIPCTAAIPQVAVDGKIGDEKARLETSSSEPASVQNPLYRLYDSTLPELPEYYPAKSYSASILMARLVELVQGPEIRLDDLEFEFGIRFVRLVAPTQILAAARGQHPLGDAFTRYSEYKTLGGLQSVVLNLSFEGRSPDPQRPWQLSAPKLCLDLNTFYKLLSPQWQKKEFGRGTHYPLTWTYTQTVAGRERMLALGPSVPFAHLEITCIHTISIMYK